MIRPVLRATAILSLTSPNSFCSFWSSSLKAASVNGSTKQLGAGGISAGADLAPLRALLFGTCLGDHAGSPRNAGMFC